MTELFEHLGGMNNNSSTNHGRATFVLLLFFAFIVMCFVLKVAASVIIPIVASILLAFVLEPLVKKINYRLHIPWSITAFMLLVIVLVAMIMLGRLVIKSLVTIAKNYQNYENQLTWIYKQFTAKLNIPFDEEISVYANIWGQFGGKQLAQDFVLSLSASLFIFIKKTLTVLLFAFFLLSEMKFFRRKLHYAIATTARQKRVTLIISRIMQQVTSYISIKFLISFITGVCVAIATSLIKLDFAILWGFLAFLLNFIPTFGSLVSIIITVLFSILQFYPNPCFILLTAFFMVFINGSLGQFIEPRITGENLGLSPFIILVSLTIWGYIWGFVGMILSVPMMVIVKIFCENISYLKPIAVMLGTGNRRKSPMH